MITMVRHDTNMDMFIFKNTLHNWALFQPDIKPILVTDKVTNKKGAPNLPDMAKKLGWDVIELKPEVFDAATLHSVHKMASVLYPEARFHCVSQPDVLYTSHLNYTMRLVRKHFPHVHQNLVVSSAHKHHHVIEGEILYFHDNVTLTSDHTKSDKLPLHGYYITDTWQIIPSDYPAKVDSYNDLLSKMFRTYGRKVTPIDSTNSMKVLKQVNGATTEQKDIKGQLRMATVARMFTREVRRYFELWHKEYEVFEFDLETGQGRLLADEI